MDIGGWWDSLSDETKAALIKGGFDLAGGAMAGHGLQKQAEFQAGSNLLGSANANTLTTRGNQITGRREDFTSQMDEGTQAEKLALQAFGKSPNEFNRERAIMSAAADRLQGPGIPNHLRQLAPSWLANGLSPQTIAHLRPSAQNEAPYWNQVAASTKGKFAGAGLEGIYGDSGKALDAAIMGRTEKAGQDWKDTWNSYNQEQGQRYQDSIALADQQRAEAAKLMNNASGGSWLGSMAKAAGTGAATAFGIEGLKKLFKSLFGRHPTDEELKRLEAALGPMTPGFPNGPPGTPINDPMPPPPDFMGPPDPGYGNDPFPYEPGLPNVPGTPIDDPFGPPPFQDPGDIWGMPTIPGTPINDPFPPPPGW